MCGLCLDPPSGPSSSCPRMRGVLAVGSSRDLPTRRLAWRAVAHGPLAPSHLTSSFHYYRRMPSTAEVAFGPYRLDTRGKSLFHGGEPVGRGSRRMSSRCCACWCGGRTWCCRRMCSSALGGTTLRWASAAASLSKSHSRRQLAAAVLAAEGGAIMATLDRDSIAQQNLRRDLIMAGEPTDYDGAAADRRRGDERPE